MAESGAPTTTPLTTRSQEETMHSTSKDGSEQNQPRPGEPNDSDKK